MILLLLCFIAGFVLGAMLIPALMFMDYLRDGQKGPGQ